MSITLKDVAARSGVSYQTVWRALHAAPGIRPATRAHVLEVARALGYRPNRLAGSLRTARSRALGLVLANIENLSSAAITAAVEAEATRQGYSVLLMTTGESIAREREAVRALVERRVDGLLLTPAAGGHAWLADELPPGLPLVAVNRHIDGHPTASVLIRNAHGARLATEHLIAAGHRRIACLFAGRALMTFRERADGFLAAMKAAGIEVEPGWLVETGVQAEGARAATRALLARTPRPTALLATGNQMVEGALLGLADLGLRHGHEVTVAGYDIPYAAILDPPVPIVWSPNAELGRRAVEVVIDLIEGRAKHLSRLRLPVGFAPDGRRPPPPPRTFEGD